jgi:hypothetical protein
LFPGRGAPGRRPANPCPPGSPPVEPGLGRGLSGDPPTSLGRAKGTSVAALEAAGACGAGVRDGSRRSPGRATGCPGTRFPGVAGGTSAGRPSPVGGAAPEGASVRGAAALVRSSTAPSDDATTSAGGAAASPSVVAPAAVAVLAAAFLAGFFTGGGSLASFSLSRLSTGASTVEEADRTNSPMSFSMLRTVLLSTPSSFASS